MKAIKMLMMAALTILSFSGFAQDPPTQKNKNKQTVEKTYICPMHPDVIMDNLHE
ncbi:hypothetical protein [Sediminibacterium sp.]|jgi:hypothetical protein|uniref:hypothetical protein n=1 Tax=Sediminibacterium sp. TaxID=1917865 RepID=UPI0025F88A36|nr:hypothetical protein [Sediminibacterium sp.]MBT9483083.1 hypothetical protein [Sediminibacterium sp.]